MDGQIDFFGPSYNTTITINGDQPQKSKNNNR